MIGRDTLTKLARFFPRDVVWIGTRIVPGEAKPIPVPQRRPLKVADIEGHLNSATKKIGLAPIAPGESTTRVAVFDLDNHDHTLTKEQMSTQGASLCATLTARGMSPLMWRSTSGRGVHVVLLWAEPQDARSVRAFMRDAVRCAIDLTLPERQVELYPKQDAVPSDGIGSMLWLPFSGESVPLNTATGLEEPLDALEDMPALPVSKPVPVLEPEPAKPPSVHEHKDTPAVRALLDKIDPVDMGYDEWRNVVFAIHSALGDDGLAVAEEWSERNPVKHNAEFLAARVWPYITERSDGITVKTLEALARGKLTAEDMFEELGPLPPEEVKAECKDAPKTQPKVFNLEEFRAHSRGVTWLVQGLLPRAEIVMVIGASGAGKSFVALDLAMALIQGEQWCERETTASRVGYIVAEAPERVRMSVEAYLAHNLTADPDALKERFFFYEGAPDMLDEKQRVAVVKAFMEVGKLDVMIVDTVARVMPGANENSGEDMSHLFAFAELANKHLGATVVFVHHLGKDESKGARGWSGIKAAADAELTITAGETARFVELTKAKYGMDEGRTWPFRLANVVYGTDENGEPRQSAVVEWLTASPVERQKADALPRLGGHQRRIVAAFFNLQNAAVGPVTRAALLDTFTDETRAVQSNVARALSSMLAKQWFELRGESNELVCLRPELRGKL